MGKNSLSQKSDYLGLPISTASYRLYRKIIFGLLKKYNEDKCFVCKESIDNIQELTVEHIKPWLNVDQALFWDLDNISFSHHKCNKVHRTNRKCELGFYWCQNCRQCLTAEKFSSTKDSAGKYKKSYCNLCRNSRKKLGLSY